MHTPKRPESPTNRHFWSSSTTTANPSEIWNIWIAVNQWNLIDPELKDASINTASSQIEALGDRGIVVDKTGRTLDFSVTEFVQNSSYTFSTRLIGATLHVRRFMTSTSSPQEVCITHEVWFTGLMSFVFVSILGATFRKALPEVVARVKSNAEKASLTS